MRIAISGAHRVGKTSLIEALSERLSKYRVVEEPYEALEEEGHVFAEVPGLDDFVVQLERSIESLTEDDARDVLFDRCPLDFVAYAQSHEDADGFDLDAWLPQVREALRTLDLLVFVPISDAVRVRLASSEEAALRSAVNERLETLLEDDAFGLGVPALTVDGTISERVRQVLAQLER